MAPSPNPGLTLLPGSVAAFLALLRPALESGDADRLARVAASRFGEGGLRPFLRSAEPEARAVAALALGLIARSPETEEALLDGLWDDAAPVVAAAEHALWTLWMRGNGGPGVTDFQAGLEALATDPAAAVARFERATTLDPRFAEAHHQLGIARAERGRTEAAATAFAAAIRCNPRHFAALAAAGHLAALQGDPERADTLCRRARMIHPTLEGIDAALDTIAEALARRDRLRRRGRRSGLASALGVAGPPSASNERA